MGHRCWMLEEIVDDMAINEDGRYINIWNYEEMDEVRWDFGKLNIG
jgi:hypothetical protein